MKKIFPAFFILLFVISCKTVHLAPSTNPEKISKGVQEEQDREEDRQLLVDEIVSNIHNKREIVYVEKPVYRPSEDTTVKQTQKKAEQEVLSNIVKPETYSGSAMIYDYNEDYVYEVYTKALRLTDIYLAPGETILGDPVLSDTVRFKWDVGTNSDASGATRQHLYIKPTEAGLAASLVINTDLRTYHIALISYNSTYMPIVRWRYHLSAEEKLSQKRSSMGKGFAASATENFSNEVPDFNFKVTYTWKKPYWLPKLVYAFEGKTYIIMPKETFQRELPGAFGDRRDLINYRVQGSTFVIDKLLDKITLKYNGKKVVIRRIN